jgi:DNA transposition AAA+ family ATPase
MANTVVTEGEITRESKIAEIKVWLDKNGKGGAARLATLAALSQSVISQVVKGEYNEGTIDDKIDMILSAIHREAEDRKVKLSRPDYVPNSVYTKISYAIQMARIMDKIVVITGAPGVGKSHALQYYIKSNPMDILIRVNQKDRLRDILRKIAGPLNIDTARKRESQLVEEIINTLAGSGRTIIIDEGEYLQMKPEINVLRTIWDGDPERGICPMVFVGTEDLYRMLKGQSNAQRQITRRIFHRPISGIKEEEAQSLAMTMVPEMENKVLDGVVKFAGDNIDRLITLLTVAKHLMLLNGLDACRREVIEEAKTVFL